MVRDALFGRSYKGNFGYRNNFDWQRTGRYDWKGDFPEIKRQLDTRTIYIEIELRYSTHEGV